MTVAQLVSTIALAATVVSAQTRVFLTEERAIARALQDADSVAQRALHLTPGDIDEIAVGIGGALLDTIYVFHEAVESGRVARRAVVVNAMGQYQPITFVVALGAAGGVERVEIMAYRESRGGEVRRRAFLQQFEGKSSSSAVRVGVDIVHITGATISSRAVADGVRLALRLQDRLLRESSSTHNGDRHR